MSTKIKLGAIETVMEGEGEIYLDMRSGDVTVGGASENTPGTVWDGHAERWTLPAAMRLDAITDLLSDITPMLQRVVDGYDTAPNAGGNERGVMSEDGQDADREIEIEIEGIDTERACLRVWDVADWLDASSDDDLRGTHGDDYAAMAAAVSDDADADVVIVGDIEAYLTDRLGQ